MTKHHNTECLTCKDKMMKWSVVSLACLEPMTRKNCNWTMHQKIKKQNAIEQF